MGKVLRTFREVNDLTGEVLRQVSNVVELQKLPPEPAYIKLYIDDIGRLHGLKPITREVLLYLAANMGYDGVSSLTPRRRAMIALTIGTTAQVVSNSLGECVRAGLARIVARGEYELSPALFARGAWADIRERRLRFVASFVYGPEGRQTLEARTLSPDEAERFDLEQRGQTRLD